MAFPEGLPPTTVAVHPTQLYEAAALAIIAWFLVRWRRAQVPDAIVLGRYCVLAGLTRFGIEFIRVNDRVFGPLTIAHLLSVGVIIVGILMIGGSGVLSPSRPKTPR